MSLNNNTKNEQNIKECQNCGKTLNIFMKKCPFCNEEINENKTTITKGLNDKFKEKEINIEFNLRSIVNELDYKKDYENSTIELEDEKYQYLQSDLSNNNYKKIEEIIKFYKDDINKFKDNGKHHLETAGAEELQEIIAKFNNVVNMCNKYKKFVKNNQLENKLDKIIILYNNEINYIKKYFVLPLYEAEKILASSRIAKNLLNIISIFFFYVLFSKLPFIDNLYNKIATFAITLGKDVNIELAICDINTFVSFMASLGITEILFAYYISFTIKNRNFKVDKHKNYEPIYYFVPVLFFVSLYKPIFSYIYNILFVIYLIKLNITSFFAKNLSFKCLIARILTIIISIFITICLIISLIHIHI